MERLVGKFLENEDIVKDSVEFCDQRNYYIVKIPSSGKVSLTLGGLNNDVSIDIYAYNDLGERLAAITYCSNGNGLNLTGGAGETVKIEIRQRYGLNSYELKID